MKTPNYFFKIQFYSNEKGKQVLWVEAMKKHGRNIKTAQEISLQTCEFDQVWTLEEKCIFFNMQFYLSVHILSHPSQDPSGIQNLPGWCKSGQGRTCWFESCHCRSSGGARELFYMKAKTIEGLVCL